MITIKELVSLIREEIYLSKNEDCGCTGPKLMLTEGQENITISEGLKFHIVEARQLIHNIYRPLSKSYFSLFNEARKLYNNGLLEVSEDDMELLESNIGTFGIYNGVKVPLDYPITLEEMNDFSDIDGEKPSVFFGENEAIDSYIDAVKTSNPNGISVDEVMDDIPKAAHSLQLKVLNKLAQLGLLLYSRGGSTKVQPEEVFNLLSNPLKLATQAIKGASLNEAEKKKTPPIGKPKRGGSKKFYVFVRKPGGGVKKVSFGDTTGLRAKLNNPKARKAFAARHNCPQKKDRTKASYWSCRLPRYAKLLGFKTSFSGFW
jgi:hypothetical protein